MNLITIDFLFDFLLISCLLCFYFFLSNKIDQNKHEVMNEIKNIEKKIYEKNNELIENIKTKSFFQRYHNISNIEIIKDLSLNAPNDILKEIFTKTLNNMNIEI
jgi:hypothetical protein